MTQSLHYRCFKPYGYLSQFVPEKRKNKPTLANLGDFPAGIMAIGRLDHDSEGLLLLTTDGMTSFNMRSKSVEKEYYVQVSGELTQATIDVLSRGVEIGIKGEKYLTLPCQARILNTPPQLPDNGRKPREAKHGPTSWISITLTEGKNRQIRKMTAAVGHPTLRLVRVRVADFTIDGLDSGDVEALDFHIE